MCMYCIESVCDMWHHVMSYVFPSSLLYFVCIFIYLSNYHCHGKIKVFITSLPTLSGGESTKRWISQSKPSRRFLAESVDCGALWWERSGNPGCIRRRCHRASSTTLRALCTSASAAAAPAAGPSPRRRFPEAPECQTGCSFPASEQSPSRTAWSREGCLVSPCS